VLALLAAAGAPTLPDDGEAELVTPTGAALLAGLAEFRRPSLRLSRVGYGLGARDMERPNALRVWLGARDLGLEMSGAGQATNVPDGATSQAPSPKPQAPILLETNIDDQPAEQLAYAVERLFELGALDAWLAPIQMKKGRVGTLLAALVPPALEDAAVALIMRETTTLGVRRRVAERHVCEREIVSIETPLGAVRAKRKWWNGEDLGVTPEYEDCARLAREHGAPLREIYSIALRDASGRPVV
jgi:uncharacterized protein (DUF111 family)